MLARLPGWGLVCGVLWVGGGSMAGGGFALHGFVVVPKCSVVV